MPTLDRRWLTNGYTLGAAFLVVLSLLCELRPNQALFAFFLFGLVAIATRGMGGAITALVPTASAKSLAWIRIVTAAVMIVFLLTEDVPSLSVLSPDIARMWGVGITRPLYRLPFYKAWIDDGTYLTVLNAGTLLALFAVLIGFKTRISLFIATVLFLVLGGVHRDFTHFFHTGLLPWYLLAALCFTPCGDAWSVDVRRTTDEQERATPSCDYGGYVYACWMVYGLTYLATGLSKLRRSGTAWWSADNLRHTVFQDTLNQIEWFDLDIALMFADAPDAFFSSLGAFGLFLEIAAVLVLFNSRARLVLPIALAGLHLGILFMQGFLFLDTFLLPIMFLDPTRLGRPEAGAVSVSNPARSRSAQLLMGAVLITALVSWGFIVERYPFSSWGMYAGTTQSKSVDYIEIYYVTAAGDRVRTDLSEFVPALSQARFLDQVHVFSKSDDELRRAERLFDLLGAVAHVDRSRVVAFEVEQHRWSNAEDPRRLAVQMVRNYRYELPRVSK